MKKFLRIPYAKTFLAKLPSVIFLLSFFIFTSITLHSQATGPTVCPINAGPDVSVCTPNCATLTGTYVATKATTSYVVAAVPYAPDPYNVGTALTLWDDQWSGVINIPFTFCFYGNAYTQCLIGSNGLITFNTGTAGGYCPWPIPATNAPTATYGWSNGIGGPWQDLYPPGGGTIRYTTYGTAPCRRFVVSWYQMPMYSCTSTLLTQQVTLYETTNVIDNYIQVRSSCGWNSGRAVQGIMNNGGTLATVVVGRNALNAGWTTTNNGQRYTPNGVSTVTTGWYNGLTLVSTANPFVACPLTTTTYTFKATYTNCNGSTVQVQDPVTVTVSSLTLTQTQTNITCNGSCTGTAGVTVTSGTGPFTYAWLPSGGAAATATGLCAGTYTCTVTGAGGCTGQATFNITQPPAITLTPTQTNVLCNGGCTGVASVTATGGTGTYTYAWAPSGGTSASATGLCAGTYTVTVSSPAGCTRTQAFTITQPPALTTVGAQTNISCNGQCTGSATVTPSGGTAPYSYSWAPSGGTGSSAGSLCAGTYTCTVTDANGCTTTRTFSITQPTALTATQSQTNVTCFGSCNGSASVTASGGTGPYTYSWSPSGGTGASATGLCATNYTCTITDANGCTTTRTFTITQPPAITLTPTQTNVTCFGQCTGTASVSATGGTGTYTYAWAPSGGTGASATGLCAGNYTVTVSSPAGCTATQTFTITQPPAITLTPTQTNILCNAQCTGVASVTATGGTGTFTYAWAPSGGTASSATNLCAGLYTVTVTSGPAGCTATQTFNITQPTALTATQSQTNILCNGQCTGVASVTASGGTSPYSYSWAPSGGTGSSAGSLCVGSYTCTITDANGCTTTRSFTITQPTALTASTSFTQATCGMSNGSASVSVSGGVGPYSYSWAPSGGTAATATGLASNLYTVTFTDANGCTGTATVNVPNSAAPTATITATTNVSCFGGNNGSATVSASGGTSPYTYSWSPSGGTGSTGTNLTATNYTVTVTDANGCTATATTTITQPPALATSASMTPVLCNGGSTGTATASASGGVGPYTYLWTPSAQITATATNLSAQAYTCLITDANGCTSTASITVTQPTAVTVTASMTPVLCNGGSTGTATASPSGGIGPYTYLWTPSSQTTATATGLSAQAYTCVVTDANGCSFTASITVTEPTALAATTSFTQATCSASNGSASVSVSGGIGPYTYLWTPSGQTTATATGLSAQGYSVTYNDANGCTGTATVNVPNASSPSATITATTNVSCFGGNNGSATVSASGGTSPYTYSWTSGGTASTETGLTAGSFVVTVADANGCTATATATITEPPALTSSAVMTPVLCNGGSTGTATATGTGGVGPYTYLWTPSGQTTATATNLSAQAYTCLITDVNGCTSTASVTVTEPTAVTATASMTPVLCNGGTTGTATATPSGGIGPYTYLWNPSAQTTATANGLSAQAYTCIVTDANGCTYTASVTVTEPTALSATTSFTQSTCSASNGSADVVVTGGVGPYTYLWNPSGQTTSTATSLSAQGYTVTFTDANGCTGTASVTVSNASSPSGTITATTDVSCFGGNDGSATVTASGGTSPYTYSWSSGGTAAIETGLAAGSYVVTISDANGCTATATATITEPPVLTSSAVMTGVLCNGGTTGTATATGTGGVGPYTYLWTPSAQTTATATNLSAQAYTCLITDANGCTSTASVTVTEPTAVVVSATYTPVSCFGGSDGTATTSASGGIGPYTYQWNPSAQTTSLATGLSAQPYTCVVTDVNGCTATASVTVTEPPILSATSSFTQATCSAANGSASVIASGGTPAYSYLWSSGGTASTETGLVAGVYTCTITDSKGCTLTVTVTVLNAASPTVSIGVPTMVSCFGGNNGSATASSTGGTTPYAYLWSNADNDSIAGNLAIGTYTVTVTDANGCTDTAAVTITEPPVLTSSGTTTDVLCNAGSTGTATASGAGGVGPYTYLWNTGGTVATETGLAAGPYTCVVTDANGCTSTASVTVSEPPALTATISGVDILCFGGNNGSATVVPTGGVAPYTYLWSSSGTGATESNLVAGAYTCTISDFNSCSITMSITLTEPPALAATTSFTQSTCGGSNGTASVSVSGGTGVGTYTYSWSSGGTAATETGLAANAYTCTIIDANGCILSVTVNVPSAPGPVANISAPTNVLCFGGNTGSATVTPTGGAAPYSYAWSNADTDSIAGNLSAGSYSVLVSDVNGCTSTATVLIAEPTLLNVQASATPSVVCEGTPVQLTATAGGGVGPYGYEWNSPQMIGQTQNFTPTATATYTVEVTDANGCTVTAPVLVAVNPMPSVGFTASVTAGCAPVCVSFSDTSAVTSGSITSWSWDLDDNTTSNLQDPTHCYNTAGNYSVILTVTTNAGCSQTITMANYIEVYGNPVAAFGASPQPATILDPEICFTDSSTLASQWEWNFGDLLNSSSVLPNPCFTYPDPECYLVTLEVTSSDGCTDTATQNVCISPDVSLYVPNTFTPDDNGLNDVFTPVSIGIDPEQYELWIFDRWGNMIFYTDDLAEGWDGRVQGSSEICQVDTYVWKIVARDLMGTQHNLIGHVNLIK